MTHWRRKISDVSVKISEGELGNTKIKHACTHTHRLKNKTEQTSNLGKRYQFTDSRGSENPKQDKLKN